MDAVCKSQGTLLDQIASEKGDQGCGGCGVVYCLCGDYFWGCTWTSTLSREDSPKKIGGERREEEEEEEEE